LKKILDKEHLPGTTFLHNDNASSHRSHLTTEAVKDLGLSMVSQPPYSPDVSPCDFFAFGLIKSKLAGIHHTSRDNLEKTLLEIFKEFTPLRLKRTFLNWIHRLKYVIMSCGKYYSDRSGKDGSDFHLTYPPKLEE
jgi:histone-lysine N-methyltransferase SETMAR